MSETLNLILLVLATLILMTWSFYSMFKTKRKIKSRRFTENREGVQKLKSSGNENGMQVIVEVIIKFLSKIF